MVKNQELALQIKEILGTLVEALPEAYNYLEANNKIVFHTLIRDMEQALIVLENIAQQEQEEEYKEVVIKSQNCYASLQAIKQYEKENDIELALNKLEFELFPLLRMGYARFYYFTLIEGNEEREKLFWEEEAVSLCKNYYIEESMKTGKYKYDVSIVVIAYNKLEYTRACVEAVIKNMPRGLRCELILLNHGSSDGTKEYFENIFPEKQIDIKINSDGFFVPYFIAEGKYLLTISNDVIIGKNTAEIMYEAMEEDEMIAYAVPVTPNITNLQYDMKKDVIVSYESMDEFQKIARKYNRRDKQLEECRVRLLNPLSMFRTEYFSNSEKTKTLAKILLLMKHVVFGDDTISLHFRRAGYKNVLMKDIYCHHFGSVTVGNSFDYLKGRIQFNKAYGIDAWERGVCFQYELFHKLVFNKKDAKRILGINSGMGSNPLKIKEELKAHTGNTEVQLINYTTNERMIADLKGVSDVAEYVPNWETLFAKLEGSFDYIIICGDIEQELAYQEYVKRLYDMLETEGILIFESSDVAQVLWFQKAYNIEEKILIDSELSYLKEEEKAIYISYVRK